MGTRKDSGKGGVKKERMFADLCKATRNKPIPTYQEDSQMYGRKTGKFFLSLFLGLALMAVSASRSLAGGTPVGAIAINNGEYYVFLVNFASNYTDAQIDMGTTLAQALVSQYATSDTTAYVFTRAELADLGFTDADALHAALLPSLGNFEAYLYITATKVANAASGTNLRFDLTVYGSGVETGMYIGAFELSEPLVNSFIQ